MWKLAIAASQAGAGSTAAGGGCTVASAMIPLDAPSRSARAIDLQDRHGAHNYHPLPVVITSAEGSWVEDLEGRRYFDALSAYSALNFGPRPPALVAPAKRQRARLTRTSHAFHNDQLGDFCRGLAELCGKD